MYKGVNIYKYFVEQKNDMRMLTEVKECGFLYIIETHIVNLVYTIYTYIHNYIQNNNTYITVNFRSREKICKQ